MKTWMGTGVLVLSLATWASAQGNRSFPRSQMHPQNVGHHAGQWLSQHRNMSPEQQRKALENDPGFRSLPPQRQERLRNQLQSFNRMTPEQQDRMISRMEIWEHLTPEQKGQARGLYQRWQQLPPDRREAVKGALQTLRAMPPEARQRAIESEDFKKRFNPDERNMLDGATKLPLTPPESNERAPEE
jgi:hypothetical protein